MASGSIEPTKFHWEQQQPGGAWKDMPEGPPGGKKGKHAAGWKKVADRDTTWRAFYRNPQGQSRSQTFATKKEAETFLASVEVGKRKGQFVDPALGRVLFDQWGEEYFATKSNLRARTRFGYQQLYRGKILPYFSGRRIGDIDRLVVARFIAELVRAGHKPKHIRNTVGVLRVILAFALEHGAVAANAAAGHKLPKVVKNPDRMFLTPAQVDHLVKFVPWPYSLAVLTMSSCGLRPAEMCGLRIKHVDLLHRWVHVVETLGEVGGRTVEDTTKSGGRRKVPLTTFLAEQLSAYLASRPDAGPDDRVFVGLRRPYLRESWFQSEIVRPAATAAGFDGLRSYDLRHSFASALIADGKHPKVIQELMGHSTIQQTMDTYGHLFPHLAEDSVAGLDQAYRAAGSAEDTPTNVVDLAARRPVEKEGTPAGSADGRIGAASRLPAVGSGRLCDQCGIRPHRAKGRCSTCEAYFKRHGVERPRALDEKRAAGSDQS